MAKRGPPKLHRLPVGKQRRLHALLEKNSEGTITAVERTSLVKLVNEAELMMVANAKRLVDFLDGEGQRSK
jgi:hypothetical protein